MRLGRATAAGAVEARLGAVVADAPPSRPVDRHREPQLLQSCLRRAGGLDGHDRVVVIDVIERSVKPRRVEEFLTRPGMPVIGSRDIGRTLPPVEQVVHEQAKD